MTKQQLTREGYQKLQQELTNLRAKADHLVGQVEKWLNLTNPARTPRLSTQSRVGSSQFQD